MLFLLLIESKFYNKWTFNMNIKKRLHQISYSNKNGKRYDCKVSRMKWSSWYSGADSFWSATEKIVHKCKIEVNLCKKKKGPLSSPFLTSNTESATDKDCHYSFLMF